MLESAFRPKLERFVIDLKISPMTLTLLSFLIGILTCPLIIYGQTILALACLWLSGFFDMLDGAIARRRGLSTNLGAYFDILSDRAVEFAVILGLFLYAPETRALLSILMLGSVLICVTTFLVVGIFSAQESEKSFHYSAGLMERAEAFIFFSAMILFPAQFTYLAALFTFLVLLTASLRSLEFVQQSKGHL